SSSPIVAEIARRVRSAAGARRTLVIAENEPQDSNLVRPAELGGQELDALWNDDFHHTVRVAATGQTEAYYSDYRGTPQELISAIRWGFLFQGQHYVWQNQRRGSPGLDLEPRHYIHYIENHDQLANSGRGDRLHKLTAPGQLRALTALLLLGPATPMLFQGQEFAASAPFLYFADHERDVAAKVRAGRREFLAQFPALATAEAQRRLAVPEDPQTFDQCKLDWTELELNHQVFTMHRDLIALSRADPTLRARDRERWHGAVLSPYAFVLRVFGAANDDRLLIVNLGPQLTYQPAPEPLLAAPANRTWRLAWSSEEVRYGGFGTPAVETRQGWQIPAHAAVVLGPGPALESP
ncbi:MAG TPA: DUF3459 domain-containing protein, partial [Longimicrobiales bacterium]|nr:DUF3459 domain-containing protein [Longimicrobiales bacterium]